MRIVPLRRTLSKIACQAIAVAAMVALFLSGIGPLVDHHFAERLPGHAHIYLGSQATDHHHTYQAAHSHSHDDLGTAGADIVFLTSNDGFGTGYVEVAAPAVLGAAAFSSSDDDSFLFGSPSSETVPDGITVGPLRRPPRF